MTDGNRVCLVLFEQITEVQLISSEVAMHRVLKKKKRQKLQRSARTEREKA